MKTLLIALILAVCSAFCLLPGAECKSRPGKGSAGGESSFGGYDHFARADADRDGFMDWSEYRDYHREASRREYYLRDTNRDDRLSREEWERYYSRRERWDPWR